MSALPTQKNIRNCIFFDLETVRDYPSLANFLKNDPKGLQLWIRRTRRFVNDYSVDKAAEIYNLDFKEESNLTDYAIDTDMMRLYADKAALFPEFSKIISYCFGRVVYEDAQPKTIKFPIKNSSENEEELLDEISEFLTVQGDEILLGGHNIAGYDIPFLIKRLVKHNKSLPQILHRYLRAKPWEQDVIDTIRLWKFNGSNEFMSLDDIAHFMGVDSPKEGEITGSNLGSKYWNSNGNMTELLNDITKYCKRDVETSIRITQSLSNF